MHHFRCEMQRQVKRKCASFSYCTFQFNGSAEELGQTAADGESRPVPPYLRLVETFCLLERFKNDGLLILRNTNTGIADGEGNYFLRSAQSATIRSAMSAWFHYMLHFTSPRSVNFQRVGQQVFQNLVQSLRIGIIWRVAAAGRFQF